jgi:hypothetical protein
LFKDVDEFLDLYEVYDEFLDLKILLFDINTVFINVFYITIISIIVIIIICFKLGEILETWWKPLLLLNGFKMLYTETISIVKWFYIKSITETISMV